MGSRGRWLAAVALAALLVFGYRSGGVGDDRSDADREDAAASGDAVPEGENPVSPEIRSPFATTDAAAPSGTAAVAAGSTGVATPVGTEAVRAAMADARVADAPPLDLQALGRSALSDEELEALIVRLSRDPTLLQALIDEFRAESDPERLARLTALLGDVDDPSVALLATELVYSGDEASRLVGLDLLKRVNPDSPDVRDVVSGLLSSESDGRILVGTLTAMARPGAADADARAELAGQVSLLTDHADPSVRRTSLDILSRWSAAPEHTSLLLEGLADGDRNVRRTAAYAMVGRDGGDERVVRALFETAANDAEEEGTRRGVILALKGMALAPGERERVLEIERVLDMRPR